jgi:hypothetical protein
VQRLLIAEPEDLPTHVNWQVFSPTISEYVLASRGCEESSGTFHPARSTNTDEVIGGRQVIGIWASASKVVQRERQVTTPSRSKVVQASGGLAAEYTTVKRLTIPFLSTLRRYVRSVPSGYPPPFPHCPPHPHSAPVCPMPHRKKSRCVHLRSSSTPMYVHPAAGPNPFALEWLPAVGREHGGDELAPCAHHVVPSASAAESRLRGNLDIYVSQRQLAPSIDT